MKYYHLSDKKNFTSILYKGLKSNENGEIFLFENKSITYNGITNTVADCIANNQLFLNEYVMFEIDSSGFATELIPDEVGEFSAKQQWILMQKLIEPKYVNLFGRYKNKFKSFYNR